MTHVDTSFLEIYGKDMECYRRQPEEFLVVEMVETIVQEARVTKWMTILRPGEAVVEGKVDHKKDVEQGDRHVEEF